MDDWRRFRLLTTWDVYDIIDQNMLLLYSLFFLLIFTLRTTFSLILHWAKIAKAIVRTILP